MSDKTSNTAVLGVVLIIFAMAFLSTMDAAVKILVDGGLAILQMLALRSWIVTPLMAAWLLRKGDFTAVKTPQVKLHLLRVAVGTGAPLCFFSALKTLPLPDTTTIFFGATFIMTALSVPILKEKVGPHRWAAVLVGFAGVLIAMRPSGDFLDAGAFYAFGGSICYGLFVLLTRKLGPGEGTVKQVFYFHLWLGVVSTAALPFVYRPFESGEIGLVCAVSGLVIAGHLTMTRAFVLAPIGILAPFEYIALVFAAALGYLIWGTVPGPLTLLGAGIIVISGMYLIYRETRSGKATHSPIPAPAPSVVVDSGGSSQRAP